MESIAIGGDHAGFQLKERIIRYLNGAGYQVTDFGPANEDRVDYPDFAHPLAEAVSKGKFDFGVLICGSANGVSMAANKHQGIRCAVVWNEEISKLARLHNNANIIALPARFIDKDLAERCVSEFLHASFEGGRHLERVSKINC